MTLPTTNALGFYDVLTMPAGKISDLFERTALEMTVVHNSMSFLGFINTPGYVPSLLLFSYNPWH